LPRNRLDNWRRLWGSRRLDFVIWAVSIYFIIKLVINNVAITSGGFILFKAINLIITNGGFAAMLGYTRGLYINITTAHPVLSVAARSNFVGCVPCWISSLRFVRQPLRFVR
jgi:hypothetical protein